MTGYIGQSKHSVTVCQHICVHVCVCVYHNIQMYSLTDRGMSMWAGVCEKHKCENISNLKPFSHILRYKHAQSHHK